MPPNSGVHQVRANDLSDKWRELPTGAILRVESPTEISTRVAKQIASEQASKARLRAEQEAKPQTVPAARKPDIGDVLSELSILWLRNPYRCKSEGLRRVTIAASLVALVYWVASVAIQIASKGFSKFDIGDWSIVFGAPIAVYAAIMTVRFLVLWVIDGFRNDRKTK